MTNSSKKSTVLTVTRNTLGTITFLAMASVLLWLMSELRATDVGMLWLKISAATAVITFVGAGVAEYLQLRRTIG